MPASVPVPRLADDASWPTRILTGFRALLILKDDAGNPEAGALVNRCFDYEVYAAHVERIAESEGGRRLLAERPSLQDGDLDRGALSALPDGTLGRALAGYFEHNGFPPFRTRQPLLSDLDYLSRRYRETHDLHHVVTGYTTDDLGEMELQAFALGNLGIRSPWLILGFGYVAVGLAQHRMGPARYVRLLRAAWARGRAAKPLIEFPWEAHWADSLADVRARLGLGGGFPPTR